MKTSFNDCIKYYLASVLILISFTSCKRSLLEVLDEKEKSGCIILVRGKDFFYYFGNDESLCLYDELTNSKIIYKAGQTEINLYDLKHSFSENGDIIVERDYSVFAYDGFYEGDSIAEYYKEEIIKGLDLGVKRKKFDRLYLTKSKDNGIIIEINSNKYLFIPNDESGIDVILIDELEWKISDIDYSNHDIIFTHIFTLSQLPENLQPKFEEPLLNYAYYSEKMTYEGQMLKEHNDFRWFKFKIKLKGNGKIEVQDSIYSCQDPCLKFKRDILKDTDLLKDYLNNNSWNIKRWYFNKFNFIIQEQEYQERVRNREIIYE